MKNSPQYIGFKALMGSSILSTLLISPVVAQDNDGDVVLEEIIVTSQKREQGLQDVPISITAISGDTINKYGYQKLEDLHFMTPNLMISETTLTSTLSIRGFFSGQNQGFEQSVGTYIDGIHLPRGQQTRAPFLDLERVEVLKGPQSILFGKNSVAGALNITTAKPTSEFEGYVAMGYDFTFDQREASAVISGPVADNLRARLAVRGRIDPGYLYNAQLDRMEARREDYTIRFTGEMDVTEDLMITYKLETGEFDVDGRQNQIAGESPAVAGPFTGLNFNQILVALGGPLSVLDNTLDDNKHENGSSSYNNLTTHVFTAEYQVDGGTFTSTTGISNFDYVDICDCDFTGANIFSVQFNEDWSQFSEELRFTSEEGNKIEYTAGLFYTSSEHGYGDSIDVNSGSLLIPLINAQTGGLGVFLANTGAPRTAFVDASSWSAFGQFTFNASDDARLTLGGRYSKETKNAMRDLMFADNNGRPLEGLQAVVAPSLYGGLFAIQAHEVVGDRSEIQFMPSVNFQWDVSDDAMLYASWTTGYKSGGFDFRANNPGISDTFEEAFEFEPEKAQNYEIGGKTSFADGRGELNFTAYYTNITDMQVSIFDGVLGFNVGNAAEATAKGIEIDGRFAASNNLVFRYGAALSDFEFDVYPNGQCYFGQVPDSPQWPGLCDYAGERPSGHAKFTGNFGFDHYSQINDRNEIQTSFFLAYNSGYNPAQTLDPELRQGSYIMINGRISWIHDSGFELAFVAKNLANKQIITYNANTPLAGSTFGAGSHLAYLQRPRTLGIQARFNF